jgi:hypothetical protein
VKSLRGDKKAGKEAAEKEVELDDKAAMSKVSSISPFCSPLFRFYLGLLLSRLLKCFFFA